MPKHIYKVPSNNVPPSSGPENNFIRDDTYDVHALTLSFHLKNPFCHPWDRHPWALIHLRGDRHPFVIGGDRGHP